MPSLSADEIITNKHIRSFIQFGSARPANQAKYAGQDAQYVSIEGVKQTELGGLDPIFVPDLRRIGQYRLVGRKFTPPTLPSATLKLLEKHGSIPRQLQKIGCQFNFYQPTGVCKDLSDFLAGWTDYVMVYSGAIVTDKDLGKRTGWDSDDMLEDSLTVTLADIYPIGSLGFGEKAAAQVDREVADIAYGSAIQCGDCGPADDGTGRLYAVTKSSGAGSPGLPGEVQYSIDGGANWIELQITGIGATADPTGIAVVGNYVVVLVPSEGAYYYAEINTLTGVPGTFTKVTTGFVAAKFPNDMYVISSREIYFVGDGGYVYKSTDITAGVTVLDAGSATIQNLQRVHGVGETIVAVGAAGAIIKSTNRGATFAVTTITPTAATVQAISVLDAYRYWVGTNTGRVYSTINGGESWVEFSFSGAGNGNVYDIVFANDEVGYISHSTSTPTARIFSTWDGGNSWTRTAPRIRNLPTFGRATRLAVPDTDAGVAANNLAVAGLSGGGTDGIVLLGIASRL